MFCSHLVLVWNKVHSLWTGLSLLPHTSLSLRRNHLFQKQDSQFRCNVTGALLCGFDPKYLEVVFHNLWMCFILYEYWHLNLYCSEKNCTMLKRNQNHTLSHTQHFAYLLQSQKRFFTHWKRLKCTKDTVIK